MIPRFRAWNKATKEMYGADDIIAINFEEKEICVQTIYFEQGLPDSRDLDYYDFDDIVLMQSTGLRDKNGQEIFEGDIIAIDVDDTGMPINARIFQDSKIGILMFHVFEDSEDVPMVELLEDNSVAFAVIGNIWEDGELLDVENTEEN